MIPGFYEFRPFDGSSPLNANVINNQRIRWRVQFFDQQTGQRIRLRERRGATEPFITVAGASWYGKFVQLVPKRNGRNGQPGVEPKPNPVNERHGTEVILRDGQSAVALGSGSVNAEYTDQRNGAGEHQS